MSQLLSIVAIVIAVAALAINVAIPRPTGQAGVSCWDLNENGIRDVATEDLNGDSVVNVLDCASGGTTTPPAITFTTDSPSSGVWTAQVQVSRAESLSKYQVSLVNQTAGTACGVQTALSDSLSLSCSGGVTLMFSDFATDAANQLNSGDQFRVSGMGSGMSYTVNLVWVPSGGIIRSVTVPL